MKFDFLRKITQLPKRINKFKMFDFNTFNGKLSLSI